MRTTGIYCRPGCSARPDPDNVTVFPLAAAAEAAGYRACHRCRPYRDVAVPGSIGPALVCEAVRMITTGALDDQPEAHLAALLGVSARHLRRVFQEHLGVTPDQLARSHRAHFARRLLDDTDLSITDVAFASGFGSVRQFQRACTKTFGAPPSELCARRPGGPKAGTDGGLEMHLPVNGALDWRSMATWFAVRATPGVESVSGIGRDLTAHPASPVLRRTVDVDGAPGLVELGDWSEVGTSGPEHTTALNLTVHLPHWSGLIHVARNARRLVAADMQMTGAQRQLGNDPMIAGLISARPALRPPGCWDPFETTVRAVLAQQITVSGARTIAGRLVERLGAPVLGLEEHGLDRLFPDPATLAEASLDGIGLTRSRAAALRTVAEATADGLGLSGPDTAQHLIGLKGIGEWTAAYVALRTGDPDAFPASDIGLREAVSRLTGGPRPDTREMRELSQRWRPWRSLAAIHLWWSLQDTR